MSATISTLGSSAVTETVTGPTVARRTTAALLAASMLTIMAAAIIAPSLPEMRHVFADRPRADLLVRLALTITSASIALFAPLAGLALPRIGAKPLLVGGLVLYAVAGTAGLWVPGIATLLVTRALLGLAVGAIMTSVSTSIATLWRDEGRARMLGRQQLFASLGGVVFLPLAGVLAATGWRAPFWIYLAAVLIVPLALGATLAGPRPRRISDRIDDSSQNRAGARGRRLRIAGIYVLAAAATAIFFMAPTQLPFLLGDLGLPPATSGIAVAASTATGAVGSLAFPALRRRLSPGLIAAGALAALGAGWTVVGLTASTTVVGIIGGALIGGVGVGVIVPNLNLWLSDLISTEQRGLVLGGLVAAIFGGQFVSPLILQPLIQASSIPTSFLLGGTVLLLGAAALAAALHLVPRHSSARPSRTSDPDARTTTTTTRRSIR